MAPAARLLVEHGGDDLLDEVGAVPDDGPRAGPPRRYETIVGVTGHSERLPVYRIDYLLDGATGASGKPLRFTMDANVRPRPAGGSEYDLLISNRDMKMLYDRAGFTVKVVDYAAFRAGRA